MKIEIRPHDTIENVLDAYSVLCQANKEDHKLNIQIFEYLEEGKEIEVKPEVIVNVVREILHLSRVITHLTFIGSEKTAFTLETLKALKSVLINEKTLRELDLTGLLLGDEAMPTIVEILTGNKSIKILNLSANRITDTGAEILHGYLKTDECPLENLIIMANKIENINLLLSNKLYTLNAAGNKIAKISPDIDIDKINLKSLDLTENPINKLDLELFDKFQDNRTEFKSDFISFNSNNDIDLSGSSCQSIGSDDE